MFYLFARSLRLDVIDALVAFSSDGDCFASEKWVCLLFDGGEKGVEVDV